MKPFPGSIAWEQQQAALAQQTPESQPQPQPEPQTSGPTFGDFQPKIVSLAVETQQKKISAAVENLINDIGTFKETRSAENRTKLIDAGLPDAEQSARDMTDGEVNDYRRELIAKHEPALLEWVKVLQQHEQQATQHAKVYGNLGDKPSSVGLASLHALGSDEREKFTNQTRGCGPAELATMAHFAIATGNKTLAAAVKVANDQLDPKSRMISSTELCDKIFGEDAKAIWTAARDARLAVSSAMTQLRQLRTGKSESVWKISRGLQRASQGTTQSTGPLSADHPTSKIARGLASLESA